MTTPQTRSLRIALLLYVVFIAAVVFQPQPQVASGVVGGFDQMLIDLGVPEVFTATGRAEFALNTLMFAPITLLGSLCFDVRHWALWVVYAFVGSLAIEFIQGGAVARSVGPVRRRGLEHFGRPDGRTSRSFRPPQAYLTRLPHMR